MKIEYSEIKSYIDDGKTPEQIRDILTSFTGHVKDIMATSSKIEETDLLDLLGSKYKVLRLTKDATWTGPLVEYFDNFPNSPLKPGFELLLTQLQISNRPVRCTEQDIGQLVSGITMVVASLVDNDSSSFTAFDVVQDMEELTGGVKYYGVNIEDVQNSIDEENKINNINKLSEDWEMVKNNSGINQALSEGNRNDLVSSLEQARNIING